jgi:prepilin-type N-terminal cleavage/methylation domain-containing protein
MNSRAFTLIELIVVIAIIGVLAAFLILGMSDSRGMVNDSVRKNDISNIYKSIVGKQTINGLTYPSVTSAIEEGKTNSELSSFINQFLATTPYDPDSSKAYLYKGNGTDFSVAAILEDGSCLIKSTGINLFPDNVCNTYSCGGIGLVQNFMALHGQTVDLIWTIPEEYASSSISDISTAIICYLSSDEPSQNELPSDDKIMSGGRIVAVVNNKVGEYRLTPESPDYYYYCKAVTYDEKIVTNPGVIGSTPNTGGGGFSNGGGGYYPSSPSSYSPSPSPSYPNNPGGSSSGGGTTSPTFTTNPIRTGEGVGNITLSWVPGLGSTSTIIRRQHDTPPVSLTEGVEVHDQENGPDPTETHHYTDTGLSESYIYCYSAWTYNSASAEYSKGFVLACAVVPPSEPSELSIGSHTESIDLSWVKGSGNNTVIRRQIGTPPASQSEGVLVYNNTDDSFVDNDPSLEKGLDYCYSVWSYNPNTGAISSSAVVGCIELLDIGDITGLTTPNVVYNSIRLTWSPADGSTSTIVRRSLGTLPSSDRTQEVEIYNGVAGEFMDTSLNQNTDYCYTAWGYNSTTGIYSDTGVSVCAKP